mmetsp:Transcript_40301/g.79374  ORF Transcript_40301/g.79374 Transcript_40301/m.79374 type:complete len:251 (+) Transcript_40301:44-796(+)
MGRGGRGCRNDHRASRCVSLSIALYFRTQGQTQELLTQTHMTTKHPLPFIIHRFLFFPWCGHGAWCSCLRVKAHALRAHTSVLCCSCKKARSQICHFPAQPETFHVLVFGGGLHPDEVKALEPRFARLKRLCLDALFVGEFGGEEPRGEPRLHHQLSALQIRFDKGEFRAGEEGGEILRPLRDEQHPREHGVRVDPLRHGAHLSHSDVARGHVAPRHHFAHGQRHKRKLFRPKRIRQLFGGRNVEKRPGP